jgi:hypothetical protein
MAYQQDFRSLGMTLNDNLSHQEWVDVYKKLIYWELELEALRIAACTKYLPCKRRSQRAVLQIC